MADPSVVSDSKKLKEVGHQCYKCQWFIHWGVEEYMSKLDEYNTRFDSDWVDFCIFYHSSSMTCDPEDRRDFCIRRKVEKVVRHLPKEKKEELLEELLKND